MTKTLDLIRKGLLSMIGLAGIWTAGHAQIIMGNGFTTACSGNFYDNGGPGGNYSNSQNLVYTIYPNAGNNLQVLFNSFQLETCCDWLRIYNGNSTSAPLIGQYTTNPGTITSTASDGSLTFEFRSDGSVTYSGWDATLSCIPLPPCAEIGCSLFPCVPGLKQCFVGFSIHCFSADANKILYSRKTGVGIYAL